MSAERDIDENTTTETDGNSTTDTGEYAGRGTAKKRLLRSVAVQTAMLSAAVHLLWAWPRLADPADPRPYVFLLGGAFTVAVAVATLRADEYRRLYALGAGTMVAFLTGYVGWHGSSAITALASDPLAIVAKGAEIGGLAAFLVLYRLAPPTSVVVERREESASGQPRSEDDERTRSEDTERKDGERAGGGNA